MPRLAVAPLASTIVLAPMLEHLPSQAMPSEAGVVGVPCPCRERATQERTVAALWRLFQAAPPCSLASTSAIGLRRGRRERLLEILRREVSLVMSRSLEQVLDPACLVAG